MGSGLMRRFIPIARLMTPGRLAEIKRVTQTMESRHRRPEAEGAGRSINLDPGYLDHFKLVLASTKNASQRIYLRGGIFAEATLFYHSGKFHGLPYTYPDYLWPESMRYFVSLRQRYLAQIRSRDSVPSL